MASHTSPLMASLPAPGTMVPLSPAFNPPILKGIKVHPEDPFRFDFILDVGDGSKPSQNDESIKLIKYFLTSLTIPENDLWVNLSPYEKNRIVPQSFGLTEMGRDLLVEDYMLKQITASLIYPEGEVGKKFWKRIYEEAAKKFGTTDIQVNTFNKVWIVPDKAIVYENQKAATAYVVESKLKVMLEQDYLSIKKHTVETPFMASLNRDAINRVSTNNVNSLGSQIIREIVIPELTKEVNEGKNFAQLRQIYNSLILATWYKKKIKDSILEQVYADKNKVVGIGYDHSIISLSPTRGHVQIRTTGNVSPSSLPSNEALNTKAPQGNPQNDVELIYQRYLKAFKKGVYNYIKEKPDTLSQKEIPRKYFSGGTTFSKPAMEAAYSSSGVTSQVPTQSPRFRTMIIRLDPAQNSDQAMTAVQWQIIGEFERLTSGLKDEAGLQNQLVMGSEWTSKDRTYVKSVLNWLAQRFPDQMNKLRSGLGRQQLILVKGGLNEIYGASAQADPQQLGIGKMDAMSLVRGNWNDIKRYLVIGEELFKAENKIRLIIALMHELFGVQPQITQNIQDKLPGLSPELHRQAELNAAVSTVSLMKILLNDQELFHQAPNFYMSLRERFSHELIILRSWSNTPNAAMGSTPEEQGHFFDQIYQDRPVNSWQTENDPEHFMTRHLLDQWVKDQGAEAVSKAIVLNLGAGNGGGGSLALMDKQQYPIGKIIHVDISPKAREQFIAKVTSMIPDAQRNSYKYRVGDIEEELGKFEDNSLDLVHAHLSLMYFNKEKTQRVFQLIRQKLKKGGRLIMAVFSDEHRRLLEGKLESAGDGDPNFYKEKEGGHAVRLFTESDLKEFLNSAGLTDFTYEKLDIPTWPRNKPWLVSAVKSEVILTSGWKIEPKEPTSTNSYNIKVISPHGIGFLLRVSSESAVGERAKIVIEKEGNGHRTVFLENAIEQPDALVQRLIDGHNLSESTVGVETTDTLEINKIDGKIHVQAAIDISEIVRDKKYPPSLEVFAKNINNEEPEMRLKEVTTVLTLAGFNGNKIFIRVKGVSGEMGKEIIESIRRIIQDQSPAMNAASNETGGIDLTRGGNSLQNKGSIQFHLDAAQLAQLQNAPGFVPVIIDSRPTGDLRQFLGIQENPTAS